MLASLHLHQTNHRDAAWNLTGAAVRVAHAIGLHRDDIKHSQSRLTRELRKQVWWTLYAFEQMQVSSYDRPSAIAHVTSAVGTPNERILGTAGYFPPDYLKWSQKLMVILGSACKALNPGGTGGGSQPEDAYNRPLSPTAAILRDLERWKEGLPSHLRLEVANSLAPSSQRPLILLFVQYYYILVLVTRSALLRRAMLLTQNAPDTPLQQALITVSETCIDAGRSLGQLLRKLDMIQRFNAVTWFDIFFTVASALVLVLEIRVNLGRQYPSTESRTLLRDLACLTSRHMENPHMPGSMRALGKIVVDVNSTAEHCFSDSQPVVVQQTDGEGGRDPSSPTINMVRTPGLTMQYSPRFQAPSPLSFQNILSIPVDPHLQSDQSHDITPFRGQDYNPQIYNHISFIDEAGGNWQDWTWDDIETIVRK